MARGFTGLLPVKMIDRNRKSALPTDLHTSLPPSIFQDVLFVLDVCRRANSPIPPPSAPSPAAWSKQPWDCFGAPGNDARQANAKQEQRKQDRLS